ncbi:MAG TPA: radical SAM protein [Nitrospirota bacterium]|nr:radical SAM protein [Nitrospirota bacterium]HUL00070.1 radical SAM protein [Nitrospirota bacterium]
MKKDLKTDFRFASIITTYRCNAQCHMCNIWKFPTDQKEELDVSIYEKLPNVHSFNVTGGEPFLRSELPDIIRILKKKSRRIVISSNGYFTDRIARLFKQHRDIGLRVSLEGLPRANDDLRGIKDGFDRGIRTLIELDRMGVKDIGFGITVSDRNAKDLLELYHLSKMMKLEFASAALHNAFYFHKFDNKFDDPVAAKHEFKKLAEELLRSKRVKDWFRAFFNYGLAQYIDGKPRPLPCEMGHDSFFLDPFGRILACNALDQSMGNLKGSSFDTIWSSPESEAVRAQVRACQKNCWMIGSVSQQMKKYIWVPAGWIIKHKFLGRKICV